MKIKMPCKLCEVSSLDHGKLGVSSNCTHSPFVPQQMPLFFPPPFNLGSLPIQNPALLRDMMLAAYLFKGKGLFC